MIQTTSPVRYYTFPSVGLRPSWHEPQLAGGAKSIRADIVADQRGLRLAPEVRGMLSLDSRDGSLGRLVLPRGFAVDRRLRCYLVDRANDALRMFDPEELLQSSDEPFRKVIQFARPKQVPPGPQAGWSIAVTSRLIYVVNPYDRSLLGFRFDDWTLAEVECFAGGAVDVATHGDAVYCLTDRAIYRRWGIGGSWRPLPLPWPRRDGQFTRVIVDNDGAPYVLECSDVEPTRLWKWSRSDGDGKFALDLEVERTRFPFPPVYALESTEDAGARQFVIPPELMCPCDRRLLKPPENLPWELGYPAITKEMLDATDLSEGFIVREDGRRVDRKEFAHWRHRAFVLSPEIGSQKKDARATAYWISPPIDSALYECRWDAVDVELSALPAGTSIVISTYTFNSPDDDACAGGELPPEGVWAPGITIAPSAQADSRLQAMHDFLVRSRAGQYLRLRIEFFGDGYGTPVVRCVTARAPRQSYIDFLPAVMREDDASRDFLERFLAVFQADWDRLEATIDGMHRTFDAEYAPSEHLDWLASWLGVQTPANLADRERRQALEDLSRLAIKPPEEKRNAAGHVTLSGGGARRGTARHLREHLAAVLASLAGLRANQLRGYPWVVEGFRERAFLTVLGEQPAPGGQISETALGGDPLQPPQARVLWGSDVMGRLQLGVNSVLGERRLMPAVRPQQDLYDAFAHRFRVVAPACWASTPEAVASLRSAIEQEKPAHTTYELTLLQPGVRIGFQSTVGVDTILGTWPPEAELSSTNSTAGLDQGIALPAASAASPLRVGDPLGTAEL